MTMFPSVCLRCSDQGGWDARREEQEHRTGAGNTLPHTHTHSRRLVTHCPNSQPLASILNRTGPTLLHCERHRVADDDAPFSRRFIIRREQTPAETCDIGLSSRAAAQKGPPPSTPEVNALLLLRNRRVREPLAGMEECEVTSRLHILCHSRAPRKGFSVRAAARFWSGYL